VQIIAPGTFANPVPENIVTSNHRHSGLSNQKSREKWEWRREAAHSTNQLSPCRLRDYQPRLFLPTA